MTMTKLPSNLTALRFLDPVLMVLVLNKHPHQSKPWGPAAASRPGWGWERWPLRPAWPCLPHSTGLVAGIQPEGQPPRLRDSHPAWPGAAERNSPSRCPGLSSHPGSPVLWGDAPRLCSLGAVSKAEAASPNSVLGQLPGTMCQRLVGVTWWPKLWGTVSGLTCGSWSGKQGPAAKRKSSCTPGRDTARQNKDTGLARGGERGERN